MVRIAGVWLLVAGALALPDGVRADNLPRELVQLQGAVQDVIRRVEPAIACILVSRSDFYARECKDAPPAESPGKLGPFKAPAYLDQERHGGFLTAEQLKKLQKYDLANPGHIPESFGSGVVLDRDAGLILTNYHVIRDATKVYVRLPGAGGSYADVHAADPRSDLAVLRLLDPIHPQAQVALGDGGATRKGEFVVAVANPYAAGFRDGSPSASWGVVSNLRRRILNPPNEERTQRLVNLGILLQTDARIDLGCSGGALLNLRGELIGLVTSQAAVSGLDAPGGFAVPLDQRMKEIVNVLKRGEEVEYGFLGVSLPSNPRGQGIQVLPQRGGPAAEKLADHDAILSVNGVPLADVDDLFLHVGMLLAGTEATLEVRTARGEVKTVKLRLAKFYVQGKVIASRRPAPARGIRVDYTSALVLRKGTTGGGLPIPEGVYVSEVQPRSPAAAAGLRPEDIVKRVNGQLVRTPPEFYGQANNVAANLPLKLSVDRSGTPVEITIR